MTLIKSPETAFYAAFFGNHGQEDIGDDQADGLVDSVIDEGGGKVRITLGVKANGTVTLNTGAAGSVDGITVDGVEIMSGPESFDTSLTQTAENVAANITANTSEPNYSATNAGAIITIVDEGGQGAGANGHVVVSSVTTIATTDVNLANGTSEAIVLQKEQWIQIVGTTSYNGIFRVKRPYNSDIGALSPSEIIIEVTYVADESGTWDLEGAGGNYIGFVPMDDLVAGDITTLTLLDPRSHFGDPTLLDYKAGIFYPFPGIISTIIIGGTDKNVRLYRFSVKNPLVEN